MPNHATYIDADGNVVDADDPKAAFLAAAPGRDVPEKVGAIEVKTKKAAAPKNKQAAKPANKAQS